MRYTNIGDEVSVEGAIVQAAQALDLAGKFAFDARDTQALADLSESWTKVADFIVALSEHEAKMAEKENKTDVSFGFGLEKDNDDKEDEDAGSNSDDSSDDEGADSRSRGTRLHGQHGQLRKSTRRYRR